MGMKCSHCDNEAIAEFRYASVSLCADCFAKGFYEKVRKANRDFHFLNRGDRIVVGVSGGKDSAALLSSLHELSHSIGGITLLPVLVNEGIAGYRNEAMKRAFALCEALGYELVVKEYKRDIGVSMDEVITKRDALGLDHRSCSFCGVFRKKLLNEAALELNANKLAIGHNCDDIAQTFLMNVMRNELSRNVQFAPKTEGRKEFFVPRIRPLMYCLERECALYCEVKNLPYYLGECPYSNEAFRGTVKDFLNTSEQQYPGTKHKLLRAFLDLSKTLKEETEGVPKESLMKCAQCGSFSTENLCRSCFLLNSLGV